MTSRHQHTRTGTFAVSGDVDAAIAALDARLKKLEAPVVTPYTLDLSFATMPPQFVPQYSSEAAPTPHTFNQRDPHPWPDEAVPVVGFSEAVDDLERIAADLDIAADSPEHVRAIVQHRLRVIPDRVRAVSVVTGFDPGSPDGDRTVYYQAPTLDRDALIRALPAVFNFYVLPPRTVDDPFWDNRASDLIARLTQTPALGEME